MQHAKKTMQHTTSVIPYVIFLSIIYIIYIDSQYC